jgi:iron complex outermembrane recepter protein
MNWLPRRNNVSFGALLACALGANSTAAWAQVPGATPESAVTDTSEIVPPAVRHAPGPRLKAGQVAPDQACDVQLKVTVGLDGKVSDPEIVLGVRPDLDALAIETIQEWEFEPALRDGKGVTARILVAVHFDALSVEAPAVAVAETPSSPSAVSATESPPPADPGSADVLQADSNAKQEPQGVSSTPTEVVVRGERAGPAPRSASDFAIKRDILDAAPHHEGVDVLRAAPGLYMGRPEGGAVAHRYMLRGFDSEHGQDIEFRVGGVPINLPSHIHGQGYADLGFLIADTVDELRVTEGVHEPRQGDFRSRARSTLSWALLIEE